MDPRITSLVAEVVTSSDPANASTEVMPQAIEVKSTSARSPFLSSRDGAMWEELCRISRELPDPRVTDLGFSHPSWNAGR